MRSGLASRYLPLPRRHSTFVAVFVASIRVALAESASAVEAVRFGLTTVNLSIVEVEALVSVSSLRARESLEIFRTSKRF